MPTNPDVPMSSEENILSPKRHSKLRIFETPMPQLLVLYETWSKQGRTVEQKWAVMNFLTGTGLQIADILAQARAEGYEQVLEDARLYAKRLGYPSYADFVAAKKDLITHYQNKEAE